MEISIRKIKEFLRKIQTKQMSFLTHKNQLKILKTFEKLFKISLENVTRVLSLNDFIIIQ
jgi:hypothetical protein